jgi:hypothetical protein
MRDFFLSFFLDFLCARMRRIRIDLWFLLFILIVIAWLFFDIDVRAQLI